MNNTWFSSDHHFNHKNIIDYCSRPFQSVEEMNLALIENHNKLVNKNDDVYFLGDFVLGKKENIIDILNKLNGNKHLVYGNHDNQIVKNKKDYLSSNLFQSIEVYKELNIKDYPTICLFHYSMRTWNKAYHGSWHLFGHSHGNLEPYGNSVDIGVDSGFITGFKEYRPFSITEIKTFFASRNEQSQVKEH